MTLRLLGLLAALALSGASAAPPGVTLTATGLSLGASKPTKAPFGLARGAALKIVTTALGKPLSVGTTPDCGQGDPMGYARFKGGLEIAFLKGKFSGWTLAEHGSRAWHTTRGIGLGASLAALRKAYPGVSIDDSSLGIMFNTEDELSGFLDSKKPTAKVVSIFAGETCMIS